MQQLMLLIHVISALGIIVLVMMQQGKGSGMGAGFGSGASGTVFGSQGALPFLFKITAGFAVLFFATSLGLAVMAAKNQQTKPVSFKLPATSTQLPLTGSQGGKSS